MQTQLTERIDRMKKCVSENFLSFAMDYYPALTENKAFRRLFMYLCFSSWDDYDTGQLLIPHTLLAAFCGISPNRGKWSSQQFLEQFQDKVLPNFRWTEPLSPENTEWHQFGKCRMVADKGLDYSVQVMIQQELNNPPEEKYYFETGNKYHNISKQKDYQSVVEEYNALYRQFAPHLNETQKIILGVVAKTGGSNGYIRKVNANRQLILDAIEALELDHDDVISLQDKKDRQKKIIASIEEQPKVFYTPSPLGRTPRLHHHGECILSLCREVRKAACHGWTDVDLVSSQFVILSNLLGAGQSIKLIKDGVNLWQYLHHAAQGEWISPPSKDKAVYKRFIYALCFGMKPSELLRILSLVGADKIMQDGLIQELLGKRQQWFSCISRAGYLTDVWGTQHHLSNARTVKDIYGNIHIVKPRWVGSLAAQKIQSIEMEIIAGVYRLITSRPELRCYITLHQHDGFCVSFFDKDEKAHIQALMQQAITDSATAIGQRLEIDLTDMKLEFSDL